MTPPARYVLRVADAMDRIDLKISQDVRHESGNSFCRIAFASVRLGNVTADFPFAFPYRDRFHMADMGAFL